MSDVVTTNPMDKVERPRPRKGELKEKDVEAYTTEEVQRIFVALENEPLKWRVLLRLLIDTGIRRGECCGLQWQNIDFKANTITIAGNLCYTPQKGIYLDTPKSGKVRTIDVDPEIIALLRELRLEQAGQAISTYVFTQQNSPEPMHPQSPARYMQKFSKRCGVSGLHPHKLRHTFSTVSLEHGMDVKTLSTIIGHVSSSTTLNVYAHVTDEMRRTAAVKIDQGIGKAEPPTGSRMTPRKPAPSTFQAHKGQRRKAGTGCVTQINESLWEGRYSPIGPDGQKHARNVYAHSEEECEKLLADMIFEMKAEIATEKERMKSSPKAD